MIIDKKEQGKWFIAKYKETLKCPECGRRFKKFDKEKYACENINCVYGESIFKWVPDKDLHGGYLYSEFYKESEKE